MLSKRLQPDWEQLAAKYNSEDSVIIAGINCREEGPLFKHKDIRYTTVLDHMMNW